MKNLKDTSVAYTIGGEPIATPVKYAFDYDAYETVEEIRAANDWLSDEEILKAVNAKRKNSARTKAQNAALDAAGIVKPTIETNDQLRLREMFKVLMSSKRYTEEVARERAAAELGLEWAE